MSNEYIKLSSVPGLIHPGSPICGACYVGTEFDEGWLCPMCGTHWPPEELEYESGEGELYEDWAGEKLDGPAIHPNEARYYQSLSLGQKEEFIKQKLERKRNG